MKGKKVLIIDDSPTIRNLVSNILQKKGMEVFQAVDGCQGEVMATAVKPDLILCDIEMPVRNGYKTCKAIRSNEILEDIPIVVLTSLNSKESFNKAIACGADDYLLKPVNEDDLFLKLNKYLVIDPIRVFRGKKVLIVEDSKTIRNIILKMLERMGFKVFEAEDGSQGEAVANAIVPDIILCDLEMPIKNGYEFCKSIREIDLLKYIPVIIVSSKRGKEHVKKAISCGAQDYLPKPFNKLDLIKKLKRFLEIIPV